MFLIATIIGFNLNNIFCGSCKKEENKNNTSVIQKTINQIDFGGIRSLDSGTSNVFGLNYEDNVNRPTSTAVEGKDISFDSRLDITEEVKKIVAEILKNLNNLKNIDTDEIGKTCITKIKERFNFDFDPKMLGNITIEICIKPVKDIYYRDILGEFKLFETAQHRKISKKDLAPYIVKARELILNCIQRVYIYFDDIFNAKDNLLHMNSRLNTSEFSRIFEETFEEIVEVVEGVGGEMTKPIVVKSIKEKDKITDYFLEIVSGICREESSIIQNLKKMTKNAKLYAQLFLESLYTEKIIDKNTNFILLLGYSGITLYKK